VTLGNLCDLIAHIDRQSLGWINALTRLGQWLGEREHFTGSREQIRVNPHKTRQCGKVWIRFEAVTRTDRNTGTRSRGEVRRPTLYHHIR
jgi:hypothetical protein